MESGDVILFYTGNHRYRYAATVVDTEQNRERAYDLWSPEGSPGTDDGTGEWEYLIYLRDVRAIDLDSVTLHNWAGYGIDHLVGFQSLNEQGHREIRERFGDIESFLEANTISDGPIAADWGQFDTAEVVRDVATPPKTTTTVSRILRNTELVTELKELYNYRCQVCEEQRRRAVDVYYAEGHHIRPLGDDGPDSRDNLLVLCPDHHADFDYGTIAIDPRSYELRHLYEDRVDNRVLTVRGDHEIEREYLDYHNDEIVVPNLRS
ncbi:HNH endonuclease [Halospeciosus flavus]|uniref:HNH endonuclease n=1 Tax=Halospeciosus flavus TaxID=3032283 RepID=A0ABD5Z196_9EURY|nr:HNH endonuclease [Halospeciosus flavus]